MSTSFEIKSIDGTDVITFQPKGVCSKLMQVKIKNDKIVDMETIGGCNGNLKGIGSLIIGMDINDVKNRLQGLSCGSRPTSCPDQLAICLQMYIEAKSKITV